MSDYEIELFNKVKRQRIYQKGEFLKFFDDSCLVLQPPEIFNVKRILVEYTEEHQKEQYPPFIVNCRRLIDNIRTAIHIAGVPLRLSFHRVIHRREYRCFNVAWDARLEKSQRSIILEFCLHDKIRLANAASAFVVISFVENTLFPENAEIKMILTGTVTSTPVHAGKVEVANSSFDQI